MAVAAWWLAWCGGVVVAWWWRGGVVVVWWWRGGVVVVWWWCKIQVQNHFSSKNPIHQIQFHQNPIAKTEEQIWSSNGKTLRALRPTKIGQATQRGTRMFLTARRGAQPIVTGSRESRNPEQRDACVQTMATSETGAVHDHSGLCMNSDEYMLAAGYRRSRKEDVSQMERLN